MIERDITQMKNPSFFLRTGILTVLLTLLLLIPSYAELEDDIIGTWSFVVMELPFTVTFNENGTYSMVATIGDVEFYNEAGTYEMSGDQMTLQITSSSDPEEVGTSTIFTNVSIVDGTLSMFDPEEEITITATRGASPEPVTIEDTGIVSGTISYRGMEGVAYIILMLFDEEDFYSPEGDPIAMSFVEKPGEYRIINIPPGRYIVAAALIIEGQTEEDDPGGIGIHGGPLSPKVIEVSAEEEVKGVDIEIVNWPTSIRLSSWSEIKNRYRQ